MDITFSERTNPYINKLVAISWENSCSHINEFFLTQPQDEASLKKLIQDDSEEEFETFEEITPIDLSQIGTVERFQLPVPPTVDRLIIAVDTGLVSLGEFVGGGISFAVRGAAYCLIDDIIWILKYNTGSLLVDQGNMIPMFQYMGQRLGNEELYLNKQDNGKFVPKEGILSNVNQVQDRCRNFVERMIQEEAIGIMSQNQRGLLLIDGALPAGTFDTPVDYMRDMLDVTVKNGINVAGISKKTRISVGGIPLSAFFDEHPDFLGYAPLKDIIKAEREKLRNEEGRKFEDITMGNELFAVRFGLGPPALAFRVDVKDSFRSTPEEVVNSIYSDCQIHGCYPKPLIKAHQHSTFFFQDIQLLLADVVVRTGARPKERQSMDWLFAPIGSFGK